MSKMAFVIRGIKFMLLPVTTGGAKFLSFNWVKNNLYHSLAIGKSLNKGEWWWHKEEGDRPPIWKNHVIDDVEKGRYERWSFYIYRLSFSYMKELEIREEPK